MNKPDTNKVGQQELVKRITANLRNKALGDQSNGSYIGNAAADHFLRATAEEMQKALLAGEEVRLLGLGLLRVAEIPSRPGKNPLTGANVTIPAKRRVTFRVSTTLKREMNPKS